MKVGELVRNEDLAAPHKVAFGGGARTQQHEMKCDDSRCHTVQCKIITNSPNLTKPRVDYPTFCLRKNRNN